MATVSVRYIVDDVEEAISFYTRHLGFGVELHPAPGFASLSRGDLRLLLNAPGAGGQDRPRPTDVSPSREVGTASSSKSVTSHARSRACAVRGRASATTS
jgi:catechol 2,3-dioxygenase-like lactoylglutathione lyase family enzyme